MPTVAKRTCLIIAVSTFLVVAGIAAAQGPTPPTPAAPGNPAAAPRAEYPRTAPQPAEPGYLGVLTDEGQSGTGLRVIESVSGGPAEKGGLATGDVIMSVNGKTVTSTGDMVGVVGTLPPGSQVVFDVDRNGQKQQVTVTLGKRPPPGERRFEQFGHVDEETLPPPSSGTGPEFPKTGGPTPPSTNSAAHHNARKIASGSVAAELQRGWHDPRRSDDGEWSPAVASHRRAARYTRCERQSPRTARSAHAADHGRGPPPS